MIQTKNRAKHIFCIEGDWINDHRKKDSVKMALDFFEINSGIKYICKNCTTREQMILTVKDACLKRYSKYEILYFAYHGQSRKILLNKGKTVSLDDIAEALDGKANRKIIHFGSCSTLKEIKKPELNRFLKKTGAIAISGYTKDISFVSSTFLDLVYFEICNEFKDIRAIEKKVKKEYSQLIAKLGFKIIYL